MVTVIAKGLNGNYTIRCLSTDIATLSTTSYGNGSDAYCMDSKDVYMFDKHNKIWILQ